MTKCRYTRSQMVKDAVVDQIYPAVSKTVMAMRGDLKGITPGGINQKPWGGWVWLNPIFTSPQLTTG